MTASPVADDRHAPIPDLDKILKGLDHQQAAIVQHKDGPALVVAGAGAGKTTTLVRRTAFLLRSGVDPSSILLLTFTRAAAKSILDRARAYAPQAERVHGGTFHSVASRLIKENHLMFGLPANFSVVDPGDVEDTLKRLIGESPFQGPGPRASTVAKIISFAVNTERPIPEVIRFKFPKWEPFALDIERLAARYVDYKKQHHILDFDDLLLFFAAMAEHDQAGELLRRRFRYVMCDEVQDCNALQMRILFALGKGDGNVMSVGDPSQSIYGFRGSAPGTMYSLQNQWPHTNTLLIETNYRSTPEIVACADRIDRSMMKRIDRKLVAKRPSEGARPVLTHVQDRQTEATHIADMILDRREEGVNYGEQAVLVRSMRNIRHVELELAARGIPTVVRGGIRIHEAGHVKDVLCGLRIISNISDEPAWMRLLLLCKKVGEKTAAGIARTVIEQGSVAGAIKALEDAALKRPSLLLAIDVLRAISSTDMPGLALAAARGALEDILSHNYDEEWDYRRKDIEALIDIAAGYDSMEEFLRSITIDVSVDKRVEYDGEAPDDEGVVTLATIHSAKGLEWHTVYMPSFIEGHLPTGFSDPSDDPDEERRLMYVLVTRAKSELVLMRPQTTILKGMPAFVNESAFERDIRDLITVDKPMQHRPASGGLGLGMGIKIGVR